MNDLFVIESARPEIRLWLFLAAMVLLFLPALGGWFCLAVVAALLLIPLIVNSLVFHFQPAQIEIRFAPSNVLRRLSPGNGGKSTGNPLLDRHRREENLAGTRDARPGLRVRSIPRSRLAGISYVEGRRFGTILILLQGCKPRTERWLWLYRLRNHGRLYVIHTSRGDVKVGEYLRLLDNYFCKLFDQTTVL